MSFIMFIPRLQSVEFIVIFLVFWGDSSQHTLQFYMDWTDCTLRAGFHQKGFSQGGWNNLFSGCHSSKASFLVLLTPEKCAQAHQNAESGIDIEAVLSMALLPSVSLQNGSGGSDDIAGCNDNALSVASFEDKTKRNKVKYQCRGGCCVGEVRTEYWMRRLRAAFHRKLISIFMIFSDVFS